MPLSPHESKCRTTVELTSLDLMNLQGLVADRIAECVGLRDRHGSESIPAMMAEEAIAVHAETLHRLARASRDVGNPPHSERVKAALSAKAGS